MTHAAMITDPKAAYAYMLGGNATFTVVSKKTGDRYTYAVKAPWNGSAFDYDNERRFVRLRTGDADNPWKYIGFFYGDRLNAGQKGNVNHPAYKALGWVAQALHEFPHAADQIEFWHEGHCARCGRQLTDPASIERGFGPDCAAQLGML